MPASDKKMLWHLRVLSENVALQVDKQEDQKKAEEEQYFQCVDFKIIPTTFQQSKD